MWTLNSFLCVSIKWNIKFVCLQDVKVPQIWIHLTVLVYVPFRWQWAQTRHICEEHCPIQISVENNFGQIYCIMAATRARKEYPVFVISFKMGSVTSLNVTHLAFNSSWELHFSEIREHNNNRHNHIGNMLCTCCAMTHSFQPYVTKVKVWQRAALLNVQI